MHLFCLSVCTDDEVLNSPSHSPVGRRTRVPSKTLRKVCTDDGVPNSPSHSPVRRRTRVPLKTLRKVCTDDEVLNSPSHSPVRRRTHEPVLVSSKDENEHKQWVKICNITLSEEDKNIILNGEWLNDKIVHAAQVLMQEDQDLLSVGSLQNPLLGQTLQFEVLNKESVQILHSGGTHWITVSTDGICHSTVKVYDSLYNIVPYSTKEQIAALLHTKENAFILEYANVQHQTNVDDCGVFAIAFAMAICSGRNPEELQFNVSVMRQHLFNCLERQQMSLFPATRRLIDPTSSKTEIVEVFCKCRLQEAGKMIYCEGCSTWYHSTCEKIPKKAWAKKANWLCSSCH